MKEAPLSQKQVLSGALLISLCLNLRQRALYMCQDAFRRMIVYLWSNHSEPCTARKLFL
jgi:hypothetical protein